MKTKKISTEAVLFTILIVAYIAVSVINCYKTKPEITGGSFPFSII